MAAYLVHTRSPAHLGAFKGRQPLGEMVRGLLDNDAPAVVRVIHDSERRYTDDVRLNIELNAPVVTLHKIDKHLRRSILRIPPHDARWILYLPTLARDGVRFSDDDCVFAVDLADVRPLRNLSELCATCQTGHHT